jgi:hypothetical protein
MKIPILYGGLLLSETFAGKRDQLGRYIWQWPSCRGLEACECGGAIGSGSVLSGEISIGAENSPPNHYEYNTKMKCMWHITVPKSYTIKMQFDQETGFDVEYHQTCGFDKVHILKGHYQSTNRDGLDKVGRFCGPRPGVNGPRPWDGTRKIFDKNSQPLWDEAHDIGSNKATVAWDSDQSHGGNGWKLRWWAVQAQGGVRVDTLHDVVNIFVKKIIPEIRNQVAVQIRVKNNQVKQLNNVITKLEKAIAQKGPNGEKSCSDWTVWVPPNDALRDILLQQHDLKVWLAKDGPIVQYAEYYIGKCKNYNWPRRVNNIYQKSVKAMLSRRRTHFRYEAGVRK